MGRPRSEEARLGALAATLELAVHKGIEAVTFEDVAATSGVAKTTLYRHFGTKQAMLMAAVSGCFVEHVTPDTGDLNEDLRLLFHRFKSADDERGHPELIPMLLAAGDRDPELRALVAAMLEERRRPVRTVLKLAQLRGEIGRDVDLEAALAMVIGPFIMRRSIDRTEVTEAFRDAVLANVVRGLRATADQPVDG
ncbi:MAG: TetR/AcrR family transcriptional regulator [Acidimicrobiales bacterium]|nr:TetR/AcrR family transcriptional regulator [Acidimicrobiales bacterium]